jgi:hypothetical protein
MKGHILHIGTLPEMAASWLRSVKVAYAWNNFSIPMPEDHSIPLPGDLLW